MAVTQTFRSKVVWPRADWSQMSTPVLSGFDTESWMGGLPTATLPRTMVPVAGGNTTMPFVLPIAVFSSTKLLLPEKIPMPKSSGGFA